MLNKLRKIIKKIFYITKQPEMLILPGQLAFSLVLSIVPIITLIVFIASLFSLSLNSIIQIIETNLPTNISEIIIPFMDGKGVDLNLFIFMVIGFYTASNGAHSIIVASNTLYNIKQSSYLNRKIKSLFLIILLVMLFIFLLIVLAFGNYLLKWILSFNFIGAVVDKIYYAFILIKWPFAFFIIFFFIKLIYTVAPDADISSKKVNQGALFTTIGWVLSTAFYSFYIKNYSKYDIFYGSLSNIIVLMLWVYLLSYILTIGIAINASKGIDNQKH